MARAGSGRNWRFCVGSFLANHCKPPTGALCKGAEGVPLSQRCHRDGRLAGAKREKPALARAGRLQRPAIAECCCRTVVAGGKRSVSARRPAAAPRAGASKEIGSSLVGAPVGREGRRWPPLGRRRARVAPAVALVPAWVTFMARGRGRGPAPAARAALLGPIAGASSGRPHPRPGPTMGMASPRNAATPPAPPPSRVWRGVEGGARCQAHATSAAEMGTVAGAWRLAPGVARSLGAARGACGRGARAGRASRGRGGSYCRGPAPARGRRAPFAPGGGSGRPGAAYRGVGAADAEAGGRQAWWPGVDS